MKELKALNSSSGPSVEAEDLQKRIDELTGKLESRDTKLRDLKKKRDLKESQHEELQSERDRLNSQLGQVKEQVSGELSSRCGLPFLVVLRCY